MHLKKRTRDREKTVYTEIVIKHLQQLQKYRSIQNHSKVERERKKKKKTTTNQMKNIHIFEEEYQ